MMQSTVFEKARTFVYQNARLLDHKRFAYFFEGGSKQDVLEALKAYQNEDGGFGHALEPDIRCPHSQPVPTEYALHVMDELEAFDESLLKGVIRYVRGISLPNGGVPLAFKSLMEYPHAPWWKTEDDTIANINPTGQIMGYLLKQNTITGLEREEWFGRNLDFIWRAIGEGEPEGYHDGVQWITFLEHAPVMERSEAARRRLDKWLAKPGVIERNPEAQGYVHKVLDWIASPRSYASKFVAESDVELHLDAMLEQQREDGGWAITFPAVSPMGELEWRGSLTVDRLRTLQAFGRL
ncbi:hypothetical protein [Paenibacillus soyae]|uniref:Prenyltransferase n=1 Tax=Paenibacillus soyae TaxID=2969249 RepID=A0A9X2S9H6_9BACL|nr:hypothetical protein [Paenibacillus soyae]MCR2802762.1 hypothetical protein [Paenibacillus soyae]